MQEFFLQRPPLEGFFDKTWYIYIVRNGKRLIFWHTQVIFFAGTAQKERAE
jgi:hypothetical protein